MDLKTLEYMEVRAKQGRELVKKIDLLKEFTRKLDHMSGAIIRIEFRDQHRNIWADIDQQLKGTNIHKSMIAACIEVANAEIARLEEEFAKI